jgi:hypothetical protein
VNHIHALVYVLDAITFDDVIKLLDHWVTTHPDGAVLKIALFRLLY